MQRSTISVDNLDQECGCLCAIMILHGVSVDCARPARGARWKRQSTRKTCPDLRSAEGESLKNAQKKLKRTAVRNLRRIHTEAPLQQDRVTIRACERLGGGGGWLRIVESSLPSRGVSLV
eukprot:1504582-Rhodomonas_salina.2